MTQVASPGGPEIKCSFCGKSQKEVKKLVAGPTVYICDECVGLCNDIICEEIEAAAALPPACPSLVDLFAGFDASVVGLTSAKRSLIAALRLHFQRLQGRADLRVPHVLIVGPRGSGKSRLGRALCEATELPSYHADVSRLSESGYVGEDIENFLMCLVTRAETTELAEMGILFLDGMEKLKAEHPISHAGRDISGEGVQRELHRLLDGLDTEVPQTIARRHPQAKTNRFACNLLMVAAACTIDDLPPNATDRVLRDRLRQAGMMADVIARFDVVVQVHPLTVEELEAIMEINLLAEARPLLESLGGSLHLHPEAKRIIAAAAHASGDGAWGLHPPMARLMTMLLASSESVRPTVIDPAAAHALVTA
jgi:ATP-dependent Clp protease ATP-binding subunit ClpX